MKEERKGALIHIFLFLCILMVTVFIGWAWYGQLDIVATASGEVIPSTKVKSIQHLEGGIVRKILVREGDRVTKNQPLIALEAIRSGADVSEIRVR